MKKNLCVLLMLAMVVMFVAPMAMADAKNPTNGEKNLGNVLCSPFRIVVLPFRAVGKLVVGKPAAVLTLPRDVRREVFDGVESAVRIPFAPAIEKMDGEMGAVNTASADAGVDWLVDAVCYGVAAGVTNWNVANDGVCGGHVLLQQSWVVGGATAAGAALLDVGGAALEEK